MSQSDPAVALRKTKEDQPFELVSEDVQPRKKTRHLPESPEDVMRRLNEDGWVLTPKGKGDHKNFKHPIKKGKVTVDTGVKEIPTGTLRSVYRQAGWEW